MVSTTRTVSPTRRLIGLALVVLAAVAAVSSAFVDWYGDRHGTDIKIQDLFNTMTLRSADSLGSLLIPVVVSAVLVLAGIVVWWRWLWALGGLVAIATAVLWAVRQAETVPGLHASLVGAGPWMAAGAGAGMLLASVIATARVHKSARTEPDDRVSPDWRPTGGQVGQPERTAEPRTGARHIQQ
jgi:MFS family permease